MKGLRHILGYMASRVEWFSCHPGGLVPPLHLRWSYYRSCRHEAYRPFAAAAAQELVSRGLEPHHRVLDVGCGLGSLAIGLTRYLTTGSYDGFDIHREAIAWCRRAITGRHPRFRFLHADLFNTAYNPRGTQKASEYRFPWKDDTFDFVFLASLCTHLRPAEVAHYLREVGRVLRPGGKCVASFYLLNDVSLRGIDDGTSFLPFAHTDGPGGSRVVDRDNPELAVSHPEALVRRLFADAGLAIEEPIPHGRWWAGVAHQQDVITAAKQDAQGDHLSTMSALSAMPA